MAKNKFGSVGLVRINSSVDVWRFAVMSGELWSSALMTIMLRTWEEAVSWPTQSERLNTERKRMMDEKIYATMEANAAWMALAFTPWLGGFNFWIAGRKLMTPFHRRAKANASRLTCRKKI